MFKLFHAIRSAYKKISEHLDKADAGSRAVHLFYLENGYVPKGSEEVHIAYVMNPKPWRKNRITRLKAMMAAYIMARNEVYGPSKKSSAAIAEDARKQAMKDIGKEIY